MNIDNPFSVKGERIIVMGALNDKSIGTGVAKMAASLGAEVILTAQNESLLGRVQEVADLIGAADPKICDVSDPASMDDFFGWLSGQGKINSLVHSIAFAEKDELRGPHTASSTLDGFLKAMHVSAWSFLDCARRAAPCMPDGGSLVAMSFCASQRVWANYNDMGVAKAALERIVKSIAWDFGDIGIRANAVSPGPMTTASAGAIGGRFIVRDVHRSMAPDGTDTTLEEIAAATIFLVSGASSAINGQTLSVNHGIEIGAHPTPWGIENARKAMNKFEGIIADGKYKPATRETADGEE